MTNTINKASLHELHVMLWTWLADNPGKQKSEWPEFTNNGGSIKSPTLHCFACEAVKAKGNSCCSNCPLQWGPFRKCNGFDTPYTRWIELNYAKAQPELISAAAKAVAELEWIDY